LRTDIIFKSLNKIHLYSIKVVKIKETINGNTIFKKIT
jgi:hypothetical protein